MWLNPGEGFVWIVSAPLIVCPREQVVSVSKQFLVQCMNGCSEAQI